MLQQRYQRPPVGGIHCRSGWPDRDGGPRHGISGGRAGLVAKASATVAAWAAAAPWLRNRGEEVIEADVEVRHRHQILDCPDQRGLASRRGTVHEQHIRRCGLTRSHPAILAQTVPVATNL